MGGLFKWAIILGVAALILGVLGFNVLAGVLGTIAKALFFLFLFIVVVLVILAVTIYKKLT